ncbi:MAG: hypothetical protein ACR2HJ_09335 [Fimbriimonadales bacterium]
MALDGQLAHMHNTRKFWLKQVAPERAAPLSRSYADDQGTPIADLDAIQGVQHLNGKRLEAAGMLTYDENAAYEGRRYRGTFFLERRRPPARAYRRLLRGKACHDGAAQLLGREAGLVNSQESDPSMEAHRVATRPP